MSTAQARYRPFAVSLTLVPMTGSIGGYVSTRVFITLGGENWRRLVFFAATILPTYVRPLIISCPTVLMTGISFSFIFAFVFIINLFLIGTESSGAVPFGTMLVVVLLWFLISAPLTVLGAFYAKKHGVCNPSLDAFVDITPRPSANLRMRSGPRLACLDARPCNTNTTPDPARTKISQAMDC